MQRMVDQQIADANRPLLHGPVRGLLLLRSAAQQDFDAGQQVVDVKRLGDEVVGAELQTEKRVAAALCAAANQDRHIGNVLQNATQHQPVLVWQDQVENDELRPHLFDQGTRGGPGGCLTNVVAG